VCGNVPSAARPGLEVTQDVAEWLIDYGGGRVTEAHFTAIGDAGAAGGGAVQKWLMNAAMSDGFQCGLVRAVARTRARASLSERSRSLVAVPRAADAPARAPRRAPPRAAAHRG
jgi:hypothetical protein